MRSKVFNWFMTHRAAIGYTIGFANIFSGLINIAVGNTVGGFFWLAIGALIVHDVRTFK